MVDPERASLVRRIFDLYDAGTHSVEQLAEDAAAQGLRGKRGGKIAPSNVHSILRNPIYAGEFVWAGKTYPSKDPILVGRDLWDRVQARLNGFPDTRPAPRNHAFSGLLVCGWCGAAITAECHKEKYVYYRCAQVCRKEKYVSEAVLSDLLGDAAVGPLKMSEEMVAYVRKALLDSRKDVERETRERIAEARSRYDRLSALLDKAYEDKLEGRIDGAFFEKKRREWTAGMHAAHEEVEQLSRAEGRSMDAALHTLELANSASELYFLGNHRERRDHLNVVLLNCELKSGAVSVTWRKPFDSLAKLAGLSREETPGPFDPEAPHPEWSGWPNAYRTWWLDPRAWTGERMLYFEAACS